MINITSLLFTKFYSSKNLWLRGLCLSIYFPLIYKQYILQKRSQWNSKEQIEIHQITKLKKLLIHCYNNVDYYHELFDTIGFNPNNLTSLNDLNQIPFLTRDLVRDNQKSLKAKNYPESAFEPVTTSGSSGNPLGFYYEEGVTRALEQGYSKYAYSLVGCRFTDRCVILRGYAVNSADKTVFWKKEMFGRWLVLSPYKMQSDTYQAYFDKINEFKPKYIQAFPSNAARLASYMIENNLSLSRPIKAVICASETLYDWQRELIGKAFQCRVFSTYGNSEKTVLAIECEHSNEYHVIPDYGIVELIDESGNTIHEPNVVGEIVTTGFINPIFPFIRYRTGDLGYLSEKPSCSCRRNYIRLASVTGRVNEFVYGKNMEIVSLTGIGGADHSKAINHIRQYQFVQDTPGYATMFIVPMDTYSPDDEHELLQIFETNLREQVTVSIQYVEDIPYNAVNGKYKFVVRNIN